MEGQGHDRKAGWKGRMAGQDGREGRKGRMESIVEEQDGRVG